MPDSFSPDTFDLDAVFEVEDYLYFYGRGLTDERSDAEVAALVRRLELVPPLQILDLACGFGRHANRLAALGHIVTGLDLMPGFLEIARREAAERGLQVDYRQGDMRQLAFESSFDLVLLIFTSFGYFSDEEKARLMARIARALRPDGRLAFDILNRDAVARYFLEPDVVEVDGNLMINRPSFDPLTGRFHNQRVVIRDGVRKEKPYFTRMYNPSEICALLAEADLEMESIVDEKERPLSVNSRRMNVVARKPR
jgi:SAM-dependent methyltransferase